MGKHQRTVFLFENYILLTKLRQPTSTSASIVSTVLATLGSGQGAGGGSSSASLADSNADDSGASSIITVPGDRDGINLPPETQPTGPTYEIKKELSVGIPPSFPFYYVEN